MDIIANKLVGALDCHIQRGSSHGSSDMDLTPTNAHIDRVKEVLRAYYSAGLRTGAAGNPPRYMIVAQALADAEARGLERAAEIVDDITVESSSSAEFTAGVNMALVSAKSRIRAAKKGEGNGMPN